MARTPSPFPTTPLTVKQHSIRSSARWFTSLLLCLTVLLTAGSMWGQASSAGSVAGQVTDPTNAVIVGATVTLTDTATKATRTAVTNDAGRYVFANVPSGTYDIKATKAGFAQAKVAAQTVQVGMTLTINLSMRVGAATEEVVVEATGAELQTTTATVGTTVSGRQLELIPNLGRDVTTFVVLQPAVTPSGETAGAISDQNTFQLDGVSNNSDMDGSTVVYLPSFASDPTGGKFGGGPVGVLPTPVESIEEFKVNTNNQTADFNGSSGSQVQMVTKRGTNTWHGAAYEYYRGSLFGANSFDNNYISEPKPKSHLNRFGAAGGGSILPKVLGGKTYIFANYEGRRYPNNVSVTRTVPSDLLRAGIIQLKDNCSTLNPCPGGVTTPQLHYYNIGPNPVTVNSVTYPGNSVTVNGVSTLNPCGTIAVPAPCDPRALGMNSVVSQLWSKYMPEPTNSSAGDKLNTLGFTGTASVPQKDLFGVARIDHDFSDKWHFFGTYRFYHFVNRSTRQLDIGGLLPGDTLGQPVAVAQRPLTAPSVMTAGLTTNISSMTTNDFHFSYLRNFWSWSTKQAPPQLPGLGGALEIGGESSNALIPMNVNTQYVRQRFWDGQDKSIHDDFSQLRGNHFLQFGGMYQRNFDYHQRDDNGGGIMAANVYIISSGSGVNMAGFQPHDPNLATQLTNWNKYYSYVTGIVSQPQTLYTRVGPNLNLQPLGTPMFDQSVIPSYNFYFSDTWHMKPTLTVTYGMGYEIQMPPYELKGKQVELVDQNAEPVDTVKYLAARKAAALQGQIYNPILGFATIGNVAGKPKYPYDPFYGGYSPRISAAWNPHFDGGGLMQKLFGRSSTVIRGGFSIIYGRLNGVDLVLVPLLGTGLGQPVSCIGAVRAANAIGGNQCLGSGGANPATAFRIGTDGMTAPLPTPTATLAQPYFPGNLNAAAGAGESLDPNFRPSQSQQFDLTVQRELSSKVRLEVGYIGRKLTHEYQPINLDSVPYMLTLGGQSFAKAYAAIEQATGWGQNIPANGAGLAPQAFFEAAINPTYCAGYASCTAAVAWKQRSKFGGQLVYDMWHALENAGAFTFARSMPSSNFGPGTSPQVSAIYQNASLGWGNYNGMFVSLNFRNWHGLTGRSNFTWGRSLGTQGVVQSTSEFTVTDPWDLHNNYGPQPFDIKFMYSFYMSYQVPFQKSQHGIVGHLLGGWNIAPILTIQSGNPNEVNISQTANNSDCQSFGEVDCGQGSSYENAIPIGHIPSVTRVNNVPGSNGVGDQGAYNINAWADPASVYAKFRPPILGLDTRTGGSGVIRGLANWNVDLAFTKDIKVTERVGVSFYTIMANAFNHNQMDDPSLDIKDPGSFGTINDQVNTPRQIQFGLKVKF